MLTEKQKKEFYNHLFLNVDNAMQKYQIYHQLENALYFKQSHCITEKQYNDFLEYVDKTVIYGVNINCKEIDFINLILSGQKVIETRGSNSLGKLIGKRIGLIETGKSKKGILKGYCKIEKCVKITDINEFRQLENLHHVKAGTSYDFKKVKYCYYLTDIEKCDDMVINSIGIVYRRII